MAESTGKEDYEESLTFRPSRKGKNQGAYVGSKRSKTPGIQCSNFTDSEYCHIHGPHMHDKRKLKAQAKAKNKARLKEARVAKKEEQLPEFIQCFLVRQAKLIEDVKRVCMIDNVGPDGFLMVREYICNNQDRNKVLISTLQKRFDEKARFSDSGYNHSSK